MIITRNQTLSKNLFWFSALIFLAYSALRFFYFDISGFIFPILIYVLAHFLRAFRLGVLLNAASARRLLSLYFYTAACSAIIPFKLGELVKINELAGWTDSYWRGLLIVWIERVFDVIALGVMVNFMVHSGIPQQQDISLFLWVISGFVFLTIFFFFIVPEQLRSLNLHVIRSYRGRKAIHILKMLDSFYYLLNQTPSLIKGKLITISVLTIFIWWTELWAISMLFDDLPWPDVIKSLARQFTLTLSDKDESVGIAANFENLKISFLISAGVIALIFQAKLRIVQKNGGV